MYFLFIVFLLFVNWGIESWKWQLLVADTEKVSYSTAFCSVMAGICVGNLTPGRAGEFIGKIFFFSKGVRSRITVLHFINGLTQLIITSLGGVLAWVLLYGSQSVQSSFQLIIFFTAAVFSFVLVFSYFKIDWLIQKIATVKMLKGFNLSELNINRRVLNKLLLLSIIRYSVFCYQYVSLLVVLGIETPFQQLILPVMLSFLLTSAIPMISFIEAAIRSAIALLVFEGATNNDVILVLAATMIWVINIVIPSAIGYVLLLRKKFDWGKENA